MSEPLATRFDHRQIADYLSALSSGTPAPGGGSAAGLAGAMGCGLGAMVCSLTLYREPSQSVEDLRETLVELQTALLRNAEADERAFTAYRDASALPKTTDLEKAARRVALENALVGAAEVPLAMVTLGIEALAALRTAADVGTVHALGDLSTGGYLLQAMILGSLENIEANTALMKLDENQRRFEHAATPARSDLAAGLTELASTIANRRG